MKITCAASRFLFSLKKKLHRLTLPVLTVTSYSASEIATPMNITSATSPFLFSLTDIYNNEHYMW